MAQQYNILVPGIHCTRNRPIPIFKICILGTSIFSAHSRGELKNSQNRTKSPYSTLRFFNFWTIKMLILGRKTLKMSIFQKIFILGRKTFWSRFFSKKIQLPKIVEKSLFQGEEIEKIKDFLAIFFKITSTFTIIVALMIDK